LGSLLEIWDVCLEKLGGIIAMNLHEAHEIMLSSDKITVLYKGEPVWIEEVDNNSETAQIRGLKTKEIMGVYLSELVNTKEVVGKVTH
jgi:small acid-soluble spore protein H (minor)